MFPDGVFKDIVPDAVKSLIRVPFPRLSGGSLGYNVLRYAALLLFLVNIRSWPMMWHTRVFFPVLMLRLRWYMLQLRLLFKSKQVKRSAKAKWLGELRPIGLDPFEFVHVWKNWASPDDCDYNMHLSNSCYAKSLDCVRLETALRCFPTLFRAGGWMALGATHYNFLREIPVLSRYEVRLRIASWDSKWIYIIARYVTPPQKKPKDSSKALRANGDAKARDENSHTGGAPYPVLHTPSDLLDDSKSGVSTPTTVPRPTPRTVHVEPDGATLNCVIVNALCFKIGRITIPPALVLASEGFAVPPAGAEARAYGPENPPPAIEAMRKFQGEEPTDMRKLQAFYAGGWRAESERWWEQALVGVEERRKAGLEAVGSLRQGMEDVRSL